MKLSFIASVLLLGLVAVPFTDTLAASSESVSETLLPVKKTNKKSSTKTSKTNRKSTSTSSSSKNVATHNLKSESVVTDADADTTTSSSKKSSTGSSLLGGILSAVTGNGSSSNSSSSSNGSLISSLTTIFSNSKIATKDKLVGTWTYTEPAVVFSSSNALKNIGGKVASQTIENQLSTQFEKYGIKKGAMSMTFDKDGNFTQTINGKTLSGTYSVSGKNVTLKYAGNVKQIVGTTQLDGSDLLIVMDASKLLKFANTIGSLTGNSLLKSAGSLLGSMDGMEVGLKLNK